MHFQLLGNPSVVSSQQSWLCCLTSPKWDVSAKADFWHQFCCPLERESLRQPGKGSRICPFPKGKAAAWDHWAGTGLHQLRPDSNWAAKHTDSAETLKKKPSQNTQTHLDLQHLVLPAHQQQLLFRLLHRPRNGTAAPATALGLRSTARDLRMLLKEMQVEIIFTIIEKQLE